MLLLQEALPGERLSKALHNSSPQRFRTLIGHAADSLLTIYPHADQRQLELQTPLLGAHYNWFKILTNLPAIIGILLSVPCPKPDLDSLYDILLPLSPQFVKWDARPGNCLLDEQDQVRWFDWEHCGARNRLDDLVWLLCDESVPDYPYQEQSILEHYLPLFGNGRPDEDALRYCRVMGVMHFCVRLSVIIGKNEMATGGIRLSV
ncbi:MAG: hypothetical protein R3E95_16875 [Thiolinea sp.]